MEKKRSVGVTVLSIFLVIGGLITFVPNDATAFVKIINIFGGIASIICAVALFRLLPWGRKATIMFIVGGIVYSFIYHSPIFLNQRIYQLEKRYESIVNDEHPVSYSMNEKKVTKEEYLAYQRRKIEREINNKFNYPYMILALLCQGLILLFLFRKNIKQQFKIQNL